MARAPTPCVAARQEALRSIVQGDAPLTVRRAFYIAVGTGTYPKTDAGYELVVEDSNVLRDQGDLDHDDNIDPTRIVREPDLWDSHAQAAR